eukprot:NODE_56_length_28873_cov_1.243101.p1 type:complete len:1847 gc:universal NODE_56_length_28873_cov_1.243101:8720-3180(-)
MRSILQRLSSNRKTDRAKALDDIEEILMDNDLNSYDCENLAANLIDTLESDIHDTYTKCKLNKIKDHENAIIKVIHVAEVLRKLVKKTFSKWENNGMTSKFYLHVQSVMFSPEALFICTEYIRMAEYILDNPEKITEEWALRYMNNLIKIYRSSKENFKLGEYKVKIDGMAVIKAFLLLVEKYYYYLLKDTDYFLEFIVFVWENERDYNRILISLEILNTFIAHTFPNQVDQIQNFILTYFKHLPTLYRQQNFHLVRQLVVLVNLSISILFGTSLIDEVDFISDNAHVIEDLQAKFLNSLHPFSEKEIISIDKLAYVLYTANDIKASFFIFERLMTSAKESDYLLFLNTIADIIVRTMDMENIKSIKKARISIILEIHLEDHTDYHNVILIICIIFIKHKYVNKLHQVASSIIQYCSDQLKYLFGFSLLIHGIVETSIINLDNPDANSMYYLFRQSAFKDINGSNINLLMLHDLPLESYINYIERHKLNEPIYIFILLTKLVSEELIYWCANQKSNFCEMSYCIALGSDLLYDAKYSREFLLMKIENKVDSICHVPEYCRKLLFVYLGSHNPSHPLISDLEDIRAIKINRLSSLSFSFEARDRTRICVTNANEFALTPFGDLYFNNNLIEGELYSELVRFNCIQLKKIKDPNNLHMLLDLLKYEDCVPIVLDCLAEFAENFEFSTVKQMIVANIYLLQTDVVYLLDLLKCNLQEFYQEYPYYFDNIPDYMTCIEHNCLRGAISRFICKILPKVFVDKVHAKFVRDHVLVDIKCDLNFLKSCIVWLAFYTNFNNEKCFEIEVIERTFDQIKKICSTFILKEKRSCHIEELMTEYDMIECVIQYVQMMKEVIFPDKDRIKKNLSTLLLLLSRPKWESLVDFILEIKEPCENCLLLNPISQNEILICHALNNLNCDTLKILQYFCVKFNHNCKHYGLFQKLGNKINPISLLNIELPDNIYSILAIEVLLQTKFSALKLIKLNSAILQGLIERTDWQNIYKKLRNIIIEPSNDQLVEIYKLYHEYIYNYDNHENNEVLKISQNIPAKQLYALRCGIFAEYLPSSYINDHPFYRQIQFYLQPVSDTKDEIYWKSATLLSQWDKIDEMTEFHDEARKFLFIRNLNSENLKMVSGIKNEVYRSICEEVKHKSPFSKSVQFVESLRNNRSKYIDALLFIFKCYLNTPDCNAATLRTLEETKEYVYLFFTVFQQWFNVQKSFDDSNFNIVLLAIENSKDDAFNSQLLKLYNGSNNQKYRYEILMQRYKNDEIEINVMGDYFSQVRCDGDLSIKMAKFLHSEFENLFETSCAKDQMNLLKAKKNNLEMINSKQLIREYELDLKEFQSLQLGKVLNRVIQLFINAIQFDDTPELVTELLNILFSYYEYFQSDLTFDLTTLDSKKMLPVLHIINSRIGHDDLLTGIYFKMNVECPHECILHLISSINHCKEDKRLNLLRVAASKIKQKNPPLFKEYNNLYSSLVELCLLEPKRVIGNQIPVGAKLRHIKDMSYCRYMESRIVKYDSQCNIQTGLSQPKQVRVICSNGIAYKQLLKGNDDLKQDVLIQENFKNLNHILQKQNQVKIRTYMVIPLNKNTGCIEWLENTVPVGSWYHSSVSKYSSPSSLSPAECRDRMKKYSGSKERLRSLSYILQHTDPILKHFFFERYKDPQTWYDAKILFIKSMAINNVVGAILGIGDRHLMNLLLDERTGEICHIDFGFAFEQSKLLPCPEYVPFRLTREFVDAFGIYKIQGPYTVAMEKSLAAFRKKANFIMSSIEILKYDPLLNWTISEEKLKQAQQNFEQDIKLSPLNADRVILQVRRKLESGLTVEHQVKQWIDQARNMDLLCQLFHGWQAWT